MTYNRPTTARSPVHRMSRIATSLALPLFLLFLSVLLLPFDAFAGTPTYPIAAEVKTTRQETVCPTDISPTTEITIAAVADYATYGYSSYSLEGGVDAGRILPDGTVPVTQTPTATLLTFFSISDIHITDKESPAQIVYPGLVSAFGNVNTSAYSPVILSTTHVLDAAIQTVNALHNTTPFDFGIGLGDAANNTQYNELRWYIDVIDGKKITPSSGAHRGAGTIDYQKPYQSAGLNKDIPFYQVMGNHDQFWVGSLFYNDYVRKILTGNTVLDIGLVGPQLNPTFEQRGFYVGTIDGATPLGTIINAGPEGDMKPPVIAADPNRRSLTTATSTTKNWMKEFFHTTTKPKGHGFTQENIDNDWASYSFEPKASVPLKVIVLDDTCKENPYLDVHAYARGCLDQARYDWLINELEDGQAQGKLMIVAAHIPVGPQVNVPDAPPPALPATNETPIPVFLSTCITDTPIAGNPCPEGVDISQNAPLPPYSVVTDAMLLDTLHNYSNLILWISGHRHINTVTPQPSSKGPEYGFWEVETASLRDFPQTFRTFEIKKNAENTLSIFVTNVVPAVQGTSPAANSRGYGIGAGRISLGPVGLTDTTPHVYNAELIKPLPTQYTMKVNVTGPGSVARGPYTPATCTSASQCTDVQYLPGTRVALVPTAQAGSVFAGWSMCSGASTCNIAMTGDVSVTATFTSAPTAAVTPAYKDFGKVKTGKSVSFLFTVKNAKTKGVANLTIPADAVSITGEDKDQFEVVTGKDKCSGKTLTPGKTCTFKVSFNPTTANSKSAFINVASDDPDSPTIVQIWGVGK